MAYPTTLPLGKEDAERRIDLMDALSCMADRTPTATPEVLQSLVLHRDSLAVEMQEDYTDFREALCLLESAPIIGARANSPQKPVQRFQSPTAQTTQESYQ